VRVRLTAEGLMLLVGGSVVLGAGKKDASPHVLGAAQLEILRFYCEHGEHGSTPPCENFEVMKAVKLGTRKPTAPVDDADAFDPVKAVTVGRAYVAMWRAWRAANCAQPSSTSACTNKPLAQMYDTLSGSAMSITPVQQLSKYAYHELKRSSIVPAASAAPATRVQPPPPPPPSPPPQRRHTRTQERRAGPAFPKNTTFYLCADTPDWTNGDRPGGALSCSGYVSAQYCTGSAIRSGAEWASGAAFGFPERNCCACGKPSRRMGNVASSALAQGPRAGLLF